MKTHDRYQARRLLSILFVLAVISPIHAAEARADDDEALIVASARDDGPAKTSASKHRAHKHRKSRSLVLWTDPKTGELFTRSGPGRVRANISLESLGVLTEGPAETRLEKKIEAKTESEIHQRIGIVQKESSLQNAALAHQISAMKPAWQEYGERWFKKIKIGALLYADYAFYTHTGFGPQFLTDINWPGPGNNSYNSFDISRMYLNFYFSPTDDWTFRLTPESYRSLGAAGSATKEGRVSAFGSNLDGDLNFRIKYAFLDYNSAFKHFPALSEDKITFGIQSNPYNDWANNLYGFRYVNRVAWSYLSLSEAHTGLSVHGPVKLGELQYVDYDFGVYGNGTYRTIEQSDTKQAMGRVSVYPFGAKSRFDGLGITGFYDYGWQNVTPDSTNLLGPSSGQRTGHISRIAALLHYTAETWGIAGEFDAGHDVFRSSNLFSGSGPFDEFSGSGATPGGAAASTCAGPAPGTALPGCFTAWDTLIKAIQNNGGADQLGWAVFGHYQIPRTPLTIFGFFQEFFPNTKVDRNPVDFDRFTAGVEYKWNKYLRFALDSQNLLYYHSQFTFPASEANNFGANIVGPLASAPPGPKGTTAAPFPVDIPFAVPRDIHSIFFNVEFNY